MKKLVWIIMGSILFITGCSTQEKTLDLSEISKKLSSITYQDKQMFYKNDNMSTSKLKSKYQFDTTNIEAFVINMPTLMESANMYMIILPKEGKKEEVKQEIKALLEKIELSWTIGNYAPKEAEKVTNRLETTYGDYLIYIISEDNDLVLKNITE